MTVYGDQIWFKSQCRQFEQQVYTQLAPFLTKKQRVRLVDAVTVDRDCLYITDNLMSETHIALYPEFWGCYHYESEYVPTPPSKLFNCFINRICPNRQAWFYQFIRKNILHKGNVSFLVDTSRTEFQNYPDAVAANDAIFEKFNQNFKDEHNIIRAAVPFCNFYGDLDQAVIETKISLVIETYFDNPNISFSEKIFRALQLPRPFVLFAHPGAVKNLKTFGFDVWEDYVDHAYDDIRDQRQREARILNEILRFEDYIFTEQHLQEFEKKAHYNRNLLALFRQRWPEKLKSVIAKLQT